jgi:hypothetical protein
VPSSAQRRGQDDKRTTAVSRVTAMPAYAKERRKYIGKASSAPRATATVTAE